jgi:ankyrin repeat protein
LHHAISEGHGDAALTLLKAGAEADKKDASGTLAIDMAPDKKVDKQPASLEKVLTYAFRFGIISCRRRKGRVLSFDM